MKLSEKLSELSSEWSKLPLNGSIPNAGEVCGILGSLIGEAKNLELLAGTSDLAKEYESLKSLLKKGDADMSDLRAELEAMKKEIEALRKEKAEREEREKYPELPDEQLQVLRLLPPPGGSGALHQGEIAARLPSIPADELAEHLRHLDIGQYAIARYDALDALRWSRLEKGNRYVLAKRRAGEEEPAKRKAYADLPELEHNMVVFIAKYPTDGRPERDVAYAVGTTPLKAGLRLTALREKGFVWANDETYGTDRQWLVQDMGLKYLDERGLL